MTSQESGTVWCFFVLFCFVFCFFCFLVLFFVPARNENDFVDMSTKHKGVKNRLETDKGRQRQRDCCGDDLMVSGGDFN